MPKRQERRITHPCLRSVAWGLFIAYAAEVGDKEAVDKMLAYAHATTNRSGKREYYYPRNDDLLGR